MSENESVTKRPDGTAETAPAAPEDGEFRLVLEPDYCCGGGHCGPLPGYLFQCPSCGRPSGCRTGEPLQPGQFLTCYLCKRRMRMIREIAEFELVFVYAD